MRTGSSAGDDNSSVPSASMLAASSLLHRSPRTYGSRGGAGAGAAAGSGDGIAFSGSSSAGMGSTEEYAPKNNASVASMDAAAAAAATAPTTAAAADTSAYSNRSFGSSVLSGAGLGAGAGIGMSGAIGLGMGLGTTVAAASSVGGSSKAVMTALRALQDKIKRLEAERVATAEECERYRQQLSRQEDEARQKAQMAALRAQDNIQECKLQYERIANEKNELAARVSRLDEQILAMKRETEQFRESTRQAENARQASDTKVTVMEDRARTLQIELQQAQSREEALRQTMVKEADRHMRDVQTLRQQIADLQSNLASAAHERDRVEQQRQEAEGFVGNLLSVNETLMEKLAYESEMLQKQQANQQRLEALDLARQRLNGFAGAPKRKGAKKRAEGGKGRPFRVGTVHHTAGSNDIGDTADTRSRSTVRTTRISQARSSNSGSNGGSSSMVQRSATAERAHSSIYDVLTTLSETILNSSDNPDRFQALQGMYAAMAEHLTPAGKKKTSSRNNNARKKKSSRPSQPSKKSVGGKKKKVAAKRASKAAGRPPLAAAPGTPQGAGGRGPRSVGMASAEGRRRRARVGGARRTGAATDDISIDVQDTPETEEDAAHRGTPQLQDAEEQKQLQHANGAAMTIVHRLPQVPVATDNSTDYGNLSAMSAASSGGGGAHRVSNLSGSGIELLDPIAVSELVRSVEGEFDALQSQYVQLLASVPEDATSTDELVTVIQQLQEKQEQLARLKRRTANDTAAAQPPPPPGSEQQAV